MYKRKKKEGELKLSIFYGNLRELLFSRNCHPKKSILGNFFPNKHFLVSLLFEEIWSLVNVLHHAENNFAGFMNCREQK